MQRKFVWALGSYWAQQEYTFSVFATSAAGDGPASASPGSLTAAAYPPNTLTATITAVEPMESGAVNGPYAWGTYFKVGGATASVVTLTSQVGLPGVSSNMTATPPLAGAPPAAITGALRLDTFASTDK